MLNVLPGGLLLLVLTGCGDFKLDSTLDSAVQKLFSPRRTPQQEMILAVSSPDADLRREAVARMAKSKRFNEDWAIKGFIAIACLDSDAQTRCVAIRALTRTSDPRAAETVLKILNYADHKPDEVWPPVDLVRWDATDSLATLSEQGVVPEALREEAHKTLLDRLRLDTDRNARVAAARGLGYYADAESVEALIAALSDDDFAVVHQCETSLVLLTGCTHGGDILAWEEWLAANRDNLFAHAGEIPESRRLPYSNRWEKASYETKDLIRWLWPGTKEE